MQSHETLVVRRVGGPDALGPLVGLEADLSLPAVKGRNKPAVMRGNRRVDHLCPYRFEGLESTALVRPIRRE
jgi:hypothetical protein